MTIGSRANWKRPVAVATAAVFLVSLVFPVVAGLSRNAASFPKWWGTLDVGWAFFLASLVFLMTALTKSKVNKQDAEASYRAYRFLTHGILALIAVFFLSGDRIVWINCLTGLAWRTWLLLYSMPTWFHAWNAAPVDPPPTAE